MKFFVNKCRMSKSKTLFSYFSKSPIIKKSNSSPNKGNKNVTTENKLSKWRAGDLVWTRIAGYPWWPSIVCQHPTSKLCERKVKKRVDVHVQFLDEPPTRGWVNVKYVELYKGSDEAACLRGGRFFSAAVDRQIATKKADDALKETADERLKRVVPLQPSDDEDEMEDDEEDEEPMEEEFVELEDEESKENQSVNEMNGNVNVITQSPIKKPGKERLRHGNKAKRRRIAVAPASDEDSGDEYKPVPKSDEEGDDNDDDPKDPKKAAEESDSSSSCSSGVDENTVTDSEPETDPESPIKPVIKKRKRPDTVKARRSFTPSVGDKTKSRLSTFTASETPLESTGKDEKNFSHLSLDFLKPDKIRDKDGNRPGDVDYDPRTLSVPDQFLRDCTPAIRQWWDFKKENYDTILFFKMGKFYELFHTDAIVGAEELGLTYAKSAHAHAGFPEIAFNRYADTLVQKGYKVARIEQVETPEMMAERCKTLLRPTKFDKVVQREVCRVTSSGTKTLSFLETDTAMAQNSYLLAITHKELSQPDGQLRFGVCFVDTSVGKFQVGEFSDDRHLSRLRTLMAHYPPAHILFERGKQHPAVQLILKNMPAVLKEGLTPSSEFWDASKTLKQLAEGPYFTDEKTGTITWPDTLREMMADGDVFGLRPSEDCELALSALGAITWYLQYSLLDVDVLSMMNFDLYKPVDNKHSSHVAGSHGDMPAFMAGRRTLVLDGVTLSNLDVLQNSATGTQEGTLVEQLDHCCTAFGKRLLRHWLCTPLCKPGLINQRLDAIEDLMRLKQPVAEATELMKKLPDLERLLTKIHSLGSTKKGPNHPDNRAIFYDDITYSKRNIEDFLAALSGFEVAAKLVKLFKDAELKSRLLNKCLRVATSDSDNKGQFPDLREPLKFFTTAFDHNKAKKEGVILPNKGVNLEYDDALVEIQGIEKPLNSYLDKQKARLACRSLVYWGSGKNRYQIEVPESSWKQVPHDYDLMSSKKGWRRYRTTEIETLLSDLLKVEDQKEAALKDTMRKIFHTFDENYESWDMALQCLSMLDVLISLAQYSRGSEGEVCRPQFVLPQADIKPYIEIRCGRHPCIRQTFSGSDFIPNDTVIGLQESTDAAESQDASSNLVVLVTGPNMGGKSTLLRQTGLIVIMAQLGVYVPAEKCCLTPVDRIFTRLGASDNIMAGESTFFVELSETSSILQHASCHSLILMDELGRGTATYDGTAIACSVVRELAEKIQCRTLFSTHYHSLVESFSHTQNVSLGHMACMVENDSEDNNSTEETITFLYKFVSGACPKSYGFNAAQLADLPPKVIQHAREKSHELEVSTAKLRALKSVWQVNDVETLKNSQTALVF